MSTSLTRSASMMAALLLTISPLAFTAEQGAPAPAPQSAQQTAKFDLTGVWVSVISEDWRHRMLTAPTGDAEGIPLNPAGKKAAEQFDGSKYGSAWTNKVDCRAYYGAGLMRMPTRLRISWASPDVLKIESDWGQQTRLLHFKKADVPTAASPQGSSLAVWQTAEQGPRGGFYRGGNTQAGGKLHVVTDNLVPGWLRRNGVPYGAKARMSEWFQTFEDPTGKVWFSVTTKVEDPEFLSTPFVSSSDFRKEPDASKWAPHPCVQS